jgi:hypothetical protein
MRVHRKPTDTTAPLSKYARSLDPGEYEKSLLNSYYTNFVEQSSRHYPLKLAQRILVRRPTSLLDNILTNLLAIQINRDKPELFNEILGFMDPDRRKYLLSNIGRSTARHLMRAPQFRSADNLIMTNDLIGELALNSNSIYRQGTDVLRELLPYTEKILGNVEYADTGRQQLFNTNKPNLLPNSLYPTASYGVNELILPLKGQKLSWVHTPSRDMDIRADIQETFDSTPKSIRVNPVGFLPKYRLGALTISDGGLTNDTTVIPWDSVDKVLAGFLLRDKQDNNLFIPPNYGRNGLSREESDLRQRVFKLSSRKPTNIVKQIKERGIGGYGDAEIDIYDESQYYWESGFRRRADTEDIVSALFPHPLVRYTAVQYRNGQTDEKCMDNLCGLTMATLPLVQK